MGEKERGEVPAMTQRLKHINVAVLFVADLERSKAFYPDTLGDP
jgi:hypothetical protein